MTLPVVARSRPSIAALYGAMVYDGALLCGVGFAAAAVLVLALRWTYPLAPLQRWALQGWIAAWIGAYLVRCWTRTGQTLALKTWRLRVERQNGALLGWREALLRYLLAWHLVLPGLWLGHLAGGGLWSGSLIFAATVVAVTLPALADPQRRLLHDRLIGARVVRIGKKTPADGTVSGAAGIY